MSHYMPFRKGYSLPHAILHIDADAFFVSCEQAVNPALRNKPVVTGQERGIASALSYEAKAIGITRGMPIAHITRYFKEVIVVPGNYELYSIFSKKIFSIIKRYTETVEQYSIDEFFADISGLQKPFNMSYEEIAQKIKDDIAHELHINVSIGLASTKSLAKLGSKMDKPDGLVVIENNEILNKIGSLPTSEIWGVGSNTAAYMKRLNIYTIAEFLSRPYHIICQDFTKPHREIWRELRGEKVYNIITEEKTTYASISKTQTFQPTTDKDTIYRQLIKNVENACIKARKYNLVADQITVFIKKQNFKIHAMGIKLTRATAFPHDIVPFVKDIFDSLYEAGVEYRSSGIVLSNLHEDRYIQADLFEPALKMEKLQRVYASIDTLSQKYGKHTVHLAQTQKIHAHAKQKEKNNLFTQKTLSKRHLAIPLLK